MPALLSKEMMPAQQRNWHTLTPDDLLNQLDASLEGLSDEAVTQRQAEYGKNILPRHKPMHPLVIFLHQFQNPLIYILLAAGIISIAIGDMKDAYFIFGVILLNAFIGTFQEWKAEKGVDALQNLFKTYTHVRRNGIENRVDAEELVLGDIVALESGNRVPADMRILEAHNLHVDESLLTGESIVVLKTNDLLSGRDLPVSEQANMLFAGTMITTGRALGIVVNTALATELGKIAEAVSKTVATKTPLMTRMENFSSRIGYLVLFSCLILSAVALFKGIAPHEVFFMAVALVVSVIPEGLPVAMTVALSVATSRMAKRKVIVRKLTAVEGLGSCTYIATDKTGTLTLNRQTVRKVSIAGTHYNISGEDYSRDGTITKDDDTAITSKEWEQIKTLAKLAILSSEGTLYQNDEGEWQAEGDPVDIALIALGYKAGLAPSQQFESVEVQERIPYESERMFAALRYKEQQHELMAIKGAAEVLLPHCTTMLGSDGEVTIDGTRVDNDLQELTGQGYRVLAVARRDVAGQEASDPNSLSNLCFIGFVALIDPLRTEAKPAVQACRQAGIKVAMVTGDHPKTALAIACDLGIAAEPEDLLTGKQLSALEEEDPDALTQAINKVSVFARVAPMQKLQIVDALKEAGHYVAVTGDGVNDAPALRAANIGVAMGSGTDVAKDAASIIITDDNFASIVGGVEEGRFAYDNIRKVVYLLVSTGFAEVFLFIVSLIGDLPLPLRPVQLLWLNLVTNGIQHVALAFEKGEPNALRRTPRQPEEGIFNALMIQEITVSGLVIGTIAFIVWYGSIMAGYDEFSARNQLLLLMVLLENVHAMNCRSESQSVFRMPLSNNRLLIFGIMAAQGLHILCMHVPLMQDILDVKPVSWQIWFWQILLASSLLVVMEVFKAIKRKQQPA